MLAPAVPPTPSVRPAGASPAADQRRLGAYGDHRARLRVVVASMPPAPGSHCRGLSPDRRGDSLFRARSQVRPRFDDDNSEFEVIVETPPGSSLAASDSIVRRLEERSQGDPGGGAPLHDHRGSGAGAVQRDGWHDLRRAQAPLPAQAHPSRADAGGPAAAEEISGAQGERPADQPGLGRGLQADPLQPGHPRARAPEAG